MPTTKKMIAVAFTVVTAAATLASTSEAHAQTAAAVDPQNVVNATPATPAAGATSSDPNIDRGFLLPTAMTQPAGSVTYNNYELLLHGVSYGITDRVQASVTVLSPIVRDMPFVGFASVKGRIVSTDRFHLALQGSAGWGTCSTRPTTNADVIRSARARSPATASAGLLVIVSASATYQLAIDPSVDQRPRTS